MDVDTVRKFFEQLQFLFCLEFVRHGEWVTIEVKHQPKLFKITMFDECCSEEKDLDAAIEQIFLKKNQASMTSMMKSSRSGRFYYRRFKLTIHL